jgi:hypothetical protein
VLGVLKAVEGGDVCGDSTVLHGIELYSEACFSTSIQHKHPHVTQPCPSTNAVLHALHGSLPVYYICALLTFSCGQH